MTTNEVLLETRNKNHLTQEQMAERLFVTRQAVSRWENGETTPSVDTYKLIAKEFGVTVDYLLGGERSECCQSCTMPLHNPDELAINPDGTWDTDYCVYCRKDGEWTDPNQTVQRVIDYTVPYMISPTMSADQAREQLEAFVPTLKRWRVG